METKTSERGITLIALLIMIIILVILATVTIRALFGNESLIKTGTNAKEDYKYTYYGEQITQILQGEIISKSAIGEIASIQNVQEALIDEEWVKTAKLDEGWTEEEGVIIVRVVEGYIYQVYYNSKYGKIIVDNLGKDIPQEDIDALMVKGRYQKSIAAIFGEAEDKVHGVKQLDLIYKDEYVGETKQNPQGEQKWQVEKIGTGWYKIKGTSNSGAIKYAYVKVTNVSDRLTVPTITIEPQGEQKAGWYGADKKELWIRISTNSVSAKEIHYTLSGAHVVDDHVEQIAEGNSERSIRFQITETGITNIIAWTEDGNGYQSEEATDVVKFDNVIPVITRADIEGTTGNNGWYKSATVSIKVEANDPKGILDGYIYRITTDTDQVIKAETHETDMNKKITITQDGKYKIYIQAIDQAGNKSATRTIEVHKDSTVPTVGAVRIENVTETGCTVSVSAGDETSGIKQYEYIFNGKVLATKTTNTVNITGLIPNQTYNVVVRVTDNAGNPKESVATTATTKGELLAPNVSISGTTRNGYYIGTVTVKVNDTSASGRSRVARIKVSGAGTVRTITGTSGSFTITSDGTYTISAWSEDASGNKSTTTTKPAFTRDATAPSSTITYKSKTANTITVQAGGADATSGVKDYTFQYKEASTNDADSQWKNAKTQTGTGYTYPSTMITSGKKYDLRVIVTDKAGWTKASSKTSVQLNRAPTITASYASKDTNYITIKATGKDLDGDKLTYKLYVSTNGTTWGTAKATLSNQTQGTQVTMTASGLTKYTQYYWKVEVSDSVATANTGKQGWVRTYCPGPIQEACTPVSMPCDQRLSLKRLHIMLHIMLPMW